MLNHSCVRCRSKKLRCDGGTPCGACSAKGLDEDCHRLKRKARPHLRAPVSAVGGPLPAAHPTHRSVSLLAREALADLSVCEDLIRDVYYWKASSVVHGCVRLSPLLEHLHSIFVSGAATVSLDDIALCMITIAVSMQYLTKQHDPRDLIGRLEASGDGLGHRARQRLLWQSSLQCVRHRMLDGDPTLPHIQAVALLLVYDHAGDILRDQLFDHAVRASQQLGLHTITACDPHNEAEEAGVRTWWFLVAHSWLGSLSTSAYSIHPAHFSTRLPVEHTGLDKHPGGVVRPTPYCPVWLSLSLIPLAALIRRLVDERLAGSKGMGALVQAGFDEYADALPPRYSLSSSELTPRTPSVARKISVERWLLHQQLFHAYLELHHFEPAEEIPDAAVSLANYILEAQGRASGYCGVVSMLRANVTNIIKAASVLLLAMMQSSSGRSSMARSLTRAKVQKALRRCEGDMIARPDDFARINELLTLEESQWRQEHHRPPPSDVPLPSTETPPPDTEWAEFVPSDGGLYPVFRADTYGQEWHRLYEALVDLGQVESAAAMPVPP